MVHGIWLNLILCFFNLIPIPPLDGSHLLYHALPPKAGNWYRGLQRFGYLPLFALIFFGRPVVGILLTPAYVVMRMLARFIAPYRVTRAADGSDSRSSDQPVVEAPARRLRVELDAFSGPLDLLLHLLREGADRDRRHPHRPDRRPVPPGHPRAGSQSGGRLSRHGEPSGAAQGADAAAAPVGGGRLGGSPRRAGAAAAGVPADPGDRGLDGTRRANGAPSSLPAATCRRRPSLPPPPLTLRPARAADRRWSGSSPAFRSRCSTASSRGRSTSRAPPGGSRSCWRTRGDSTGWRRSAPRPTIVDVLSTLLALLELAKRGSLRLTATVSVLADGDRA